MLVRTSIQIFLKKKYGYLRNYLRGQRGVLRGLFRRRPGEQRAHLQAAPEEQQTVKYLRIALTDPQMTSLERRRKAVEDAFPGQRVTVTDLVRRWLCGPDEAPQAPPSGLTPTARAAPAPLTTAPRASLHERLEAIARHEPVPAAAPAAPAGESVYDRMLAKRDAFGPAFDPEKLPADEYEAYLEVFTPSGAKK